MQWWMFINDWNYGYGKDKVILKRSDPTNSQIMNVYKLTKEERKTLGLKGREWALSDEAGLTGEKMGERVINTLNKLFTTWTPRKKYELINTNNKEIKTVPHNLTY
jgi:hypothetical protein